MNISAVILSDKPVDLTIDGVSIVPFVSKFSGPAGLLASRFAAVERVETEWFFMLDDDDALPENYAEILEECVSGPEPLAYTNELVTDQTGSAIRIAGPYSEEAFIADPTLIHHLAVCRTDVALTELKKLPLGLYAFEHLLYFAVARHGAHWIDAVGYLWRKRALGMHRDPRMLTALLESIAYAEGGAS